MDNNQIIVMPVVRRKPWVNTSQFNKNKVMEANTTVQAYSGQNGLQTGLEGNKELQEEFEKELGLAPGTLAPTLSNDYWSEEVNIKLEDGPTTFSKSHPKDRLKILILQNHPLVANSLAEVSPETDFYIVDEVLEQEKKLNKAEKKERAYAIFSEMSPSEKRQFLKMIGKGGNEMSDVDVKAELSTILEDNVDDFLSKSEFSKEKLTIRAFIFDLVQYGILRIRGGHYFDSDEDKGNLEALTTYFLSPSKQDAYLTYKERLEHAKLGN